MTDSVDAILTLDRGDLLDRWETTFGRPPPSHTHASFLRLALVWQVQAGKQGIGKTKIVRPGATKSTTGTVFRPGTKLVREWQGRTHHVAVTEAGYEYAGKPYRSLTAIAKAITGTVWSGPAFFGIKAGEGK